MTISEINFLRAFRSRNYTLYFTGRGISQFGTWMQRTAVIWVVYAITHSAFLIGVTVFAEQFPSFLFSFLGGVAADRYNRYRIIKITQIASMAQSVLLSLLVLMHFMLVWAILALSVILGIINAFDVPARQALVHDVVEDPADLPNALSLTTAMASMAQLLGPALAGIVLNSLGAAACFLINAASFGGVLVSLLLMKLPPHVPTSVQKRFRAEFTEGLKYLKHTPSIATMIWLLALVSLLVLPYTTVLPVFAKVVFKGNAATFGYINSFVGLGAVAGTVFLASRKPGAHLKSILFACTVILAVSLIGFALAHHFALAMFFAAWSGFGSVAQFTIGNIIVQSQSEPQMRGRVVGVLLMAIFGMLPLGSLLIGALSEHIGAPMAVLSQGVICLALAAGFMNFLNRRSQ